MKKRTLSPDFLAALGAGAVSPEAAQAVATGADETDTADKPEGGNAPAPKAEDTAAPVQAETDEPADPPAPPPAPNANAETPSLVAHLRTELKELRAEMSTLQLEHAKAKEKLAGVEASQPKLVAIVKKASEIMAIALGTTAVGMDAMSPEALCEYHGQLSAAMAKKYPVGGRAVDTAQPAKEELSTTDASNPARQAAVKSSSIQ